MSCQPFWKCFCRCGELTIDPEIFVKFLEVLIRGEIEGEVSAEGNTITVQFTDGTCRTVTVG